MTELIRFAGDCDIDDITVYSMNGTMMNIAAQVLDIQIYEDLFSPFMTGTLVLKESFDLVNLFPFNGQEFVYIKATTPTLESGNLEQIFYIYKLSNRELIGDRSVSYVLHFISQEAIVDVNKKVSKSCQGRVSDIARLFIEDHTDGLETKRSINVEDTTNGMKYVSNFWSPVRNLSYLTKHAVSSLDASNFTFFENRDGFNFVSLDSLNMKPVYQEFTYDNYNSPVTEDGRIMRDVNEDYKHIRHISIPTAFDYIERATNGTIGSTMVGLDINTKKYYFSEYNLLDNFVAEQSLNEFPLVSNNDIFRPIASFMNLNRAYSTHTGYTDITNSQIVQRRTSLLQRSNGSKITIVVPGRLDYTVGQKVMVNLNKIQPISQDDDDYRDKMFSGHYLIVAINHNINRSEHLCTMELAKDSLELDVNGIKDE